MSNQYRNILKATSIFGGVQLLQILINLARSKFIAILIGAEGMGLSSIYTTTINTIVVVCGLGLNVSVVRDLSKAKEDDNNFEFSKVSKIFEIACFLLGIVSIILTCTTSKYLSDFAFENESYALNFALLSLMSFFTIMTQANTAILIGARKIKYTAMCSAYGSVITLISSVPFFYFWGTNGIVPGLILSTFFNYLVTLFYKRKINLVSVKLNLRDSIKYIKTAAALGIAMVIGGLLLKLTTYLINIGISRIGDITDVGLFNAGMSITMEAVILVFAAMSSDYYPRLVASLKDRNTMNDTVNQQSEIIIYLAVPLLATLMISSNIVIYTLLSDEFQVINSFVKILCIGMFIKAISYALGYITFAEGDKKTYLIYEGAIANITNLIISILAYLMFGLIGLAMGFCINYLAYFMLIREVVKRKYGYSSTKELNSLIVKSGLILFLLFLINCFFQGWAKYVVSIVALLPTYYFYIKKLNLKTGIITVLKNKLKTVK